MDKVRMLGRRLAPVLALVLALLLASTLFHVATASAQGGCDEVVADDAGALGPRLAEVGAEADRLVALGADVRVRTVASLGGAPTLDAYEAGLERVCASWQAPGGGRKNNLIVLLVAPTQRTTGLYYGSTWERTLGASWTRIQADTMNPRFRDGDIAGGLIAGLQEIRGLVDQQLHPQQAPAANPIGATAPQRGAAGTIVLGAFVLLGATLVVLAVGTTVRAGRVKRRLAQQEAMTAQRAVASRVSAYPDELKELRLRLDVLATQVATEEVRPLYDGLAEAQRLADRATVDYGTAHDAAADPETAKLSAQEYRQIRDAYAPITDLARQADDRESALRQQATDLERAIAEAPQRIAGAGAAIEPARGKLQAIAQRGFKVDDCSAMLDRAGTLAREAAAAVGEKRFGTASAKAAEADSLVHQAVSTAEGYPALREELVASIDRVAPRLSSAQEAVEAGRATLSAMQDSYAEPLWRSVGEEAERMPARLRSAETSLAAARTAASMERQAWDEARSSLAQAMGELDAVDACLEAIRSLGQRLDQARDAAPGELARAQAAVEGAAAAVDDLERDERPQVAAELEEAQRKLAQAAEMLQGARPDVVAIASLAREAADAADGIAQRARAARRAREQERESGRAIRDSILTSIIINAILSGGRGRSGGRGGWSGPGSFGGGGSTGWGGGGGGGGSSKW